MKNTFIAKRRHPVLAEKESVYKLISDCYSGGYAFKKGDHLFQYSREQTAAYRKRVERAIYINHVQPLADMMVGFLFKEQVDRKYPSKVSDFIDGAWKGRSLDVAMQYIAVHSLLYTVGVLVDSPKFDAESIVTEGDRQDADLHPYLIIYYPWQIRDFAYTSNGELLWVLLDDTENDSSDPFEPPVETTKYKLWTREFFQTFEVKINERGRLEVEEGDVIPHPCGRVPFVLSNWKDVELDFISDSVFEDIAYMSRTIFNYFSYLDEILASSAFKSLFFPVKDVKNDIPKNVQEKGFAEQAIIPYRGDISGQPFFAAPESGDVIKYVDMMTYLSKEIFKKVGLDKDEEKGFAQSGEAKRREFMKAASLLKMGAGVMEAVETDLIKIAAAWMNISDAEVEVKYSHDYDNEDIKSKLERLQAALEVPVFEIQRKVYAILLKTTLKEDMSREELEKVMKLVEGMSEAEKTADDLDSFYRGNPDKNNTAKPGADISGSRGENPDKTGGV